jgi:hypothetical protein
VSRAHSIAVDPDPWLQAEALLGKPWVKIYRERSDDFFRGHSRKKTLEGHSLDLAYIDGLHEFAQVIRDLENVERWGHPNTVAAVHDVVPRSASEATRRFRRGGWTGDVWRIVPFLRERRPNLHCRLVAVDPTGFLLVTHFDPSHRGMGEIAAALDCDFPPDGEEYVHLVEAYLTQARPENPEAVLRELAASVASESA